MINDIGTLDLESSWPARGISPEESSSDSKIMTPARVMKTVMVFFEIKSENILRLSFALPCHIIIRLMTRPVSIAMSFQEAGLSPEKIFSKRPVYHDRLFF